MSTVKIYFHCIHYSLPQLCLQALDPSMTDLCFPANCIACLNFRSTTTQTLSLCFDATDRSSLSSRYSPSSTVLQRTPTIFSGSQPKPHAATPRLSHVVHCCYLYLELTSNKVNGRQMDETNATGHGLQLHFGAMATMLLWCIVCLPSGLTILHRFVWLTN